MQSKVKRVAVIGPESTGKSVLCEQLANHFSTIWIPEFAREYLPKINRQYSLEDVIQIYTTQFKQESELLHQANKFIFTDTEFIVAKVWCENAFGVCPDIISSHIKNHPYDFYLLTSPDLPWQPDPLRENPGKGDYFFKWYLKILMEEKLNFGIVEGVNENRFNCALLLINELNFQ